MNSVAATVTVVLVLVCLLICPGAAVTIQSVEVPRYVKFGSEFVNFSCEFVHGPLDEQLIIKWFHSDDRSPVLQWIPGIDSLDTSGILAGKVSIPEAKQLSKDFTNSLTSRSAFRVRRPGLELTGNYTCYVTSLANTDQRDEPLTVFVAPHQSKLYYNNERRMMVCHIQGLFPSPKVSLFMVSKRGELEEETEHLKRQDKVNENGTIDIVVMKYFSSAPSDHFECWAFLDVNNMILAKAHYYADQNSILDYDSIQTGSAATVQPGWIVHFTTLFTFYVYCIAFPR